MQDIISLSKYKNTTIFNISRRLLLVCIIYSFGSCAYTKYVPEDKHLLRKNQVILHSDRKGNEKGELKDQLESLYAQQPNTYYLGILPFKLWYYQQKHQVALQQGRFPNTSSKLQEAPVLLDTNLIEQTKQNMRFQMNNAGYFYSNIQDSIRYTDKKAFVQYIVDAGKRFIIGEKYFDISDGAISEIVHNAESNSLLKKGQFYSNTITGEERTRMTNIIRDKGYYHFSAENIRFELDTLAGKDTLVRGDNIMSSIVDMVLQSQISSQELNIKTIISDNKDGTAFKKATIGNVVVFTSVDENATLGRYFSLANQDSLFQDIQVYDHGTPYIHHNIVKRNIAIKPGNTYAITDYDRTISQLNNLGVFQYVRIRYAERKDSLGNPRLNVIIMLAPNKKYDFSTNVEVSGGDIYVLGTAANVTITNKNVLKGANQLSLTGSYGIELGTRMNDQSSNEFYLFSQNYGANLSFMMPKFLLPINNDRVKANVFPRTIMNVGINSIYRSQFFLLQSINANINYQWNSSPNLKWNVKPIFIHSLDLSRISPAFQERMNNIPAIRNAYQQTFIEGQGAEMIYNKIAHTGTRQYYLRVGLEEAGLLMSGIDALFPINQYAQYVKLDWDAKAYYRRHLSTIALRFYGGVGLPYGNAQTMPYLKQYFVGGAYSIRGWRPRVLGPGSYYNPAMNAQINNLFMDQSGDIKLELNAEYRFTLARLFSNSISINGAVFTDAGNIWLAKEDVTLPNAEFKLNRLYQDIAMSTGAGLRFDLGGFLVLRFDYAFPIKKPYIQENYGWVIDKVSLGDKEWRKNNLNFNIAVGYPF